VTDRHHSTISDPNDVAAGRHAPDGARRLWFLQQLNGDTRAYHIIESYHVVGPLDREALGRALGPVSKVDLCSSVRGMFGSSGTVGLGCNPGAATTGDRTTEDREFPLLAPVPMSTASPLVTATH